MAKESKFQKHVIDRIYLEFPGATVLKNDSGYLQGVPDLTIFWGVHWAMLEVKQYLGAPYRPNQEYWIEKFDQDSFCRMICPQNEEQVFYELHQTFGA